VGKFVEVTPEEQARIPGPGDRGLSHRLVGEFLESSLYMARLDRSELNQTAQALVSSLVGYAQRHPDVPVKVFMRSGEVYFMRTDRDREGRPIAEVPEVPLEKEVVTRGGRRLDLQD
jgi:hypothetical protein